MAMNKIAKQTSAVLLCGHGSRSPQAGTEFYALMDKIRRKLWGQELFGAFLGHTSPSIPEVLQQIYDQGHRDIMVQPAMLYNAGHMKIDIPDIVAQFRKTHPDAQLYCGGPLGVGALVVEAAASAVTAVLPPCDGEDVTLLVVGRGSKERAVSDQIITLCRKLDTRLDVGDSRYCYFSDGVPLLSSALTQAAHSHYSHVVVLPFLLFPGRLLSHIYAEIDKVAVQHPAFAFHKAPAIGMQDVIADALVQKINEATLVI
ncbi:MAG TPA: hypothetical protein ENI91_05340 [Sphingomonadales bacterium]|nr:hypothetical protein [Sphingomonadales bacterium]